MRIRFTEIAPGLGPSELVVGVRTVEATQEGVVTSRRQANDRSVEVGSPIIDEPSRCLVELPRGSVSGGWRVWIPRSEVINPVTVQAAE